nr:hypothetical protein L203_05899 [Cryptococcus depauperatus CBS 7841]
MIRSNPTAIPLRASDLSSLQAEIDRRKTERQDSASSVATAQKEIVGQVPSQAGQGTLGESIGGAEQERRERHERIGL